MGCGSCRRQWTCELARQLRRNGLAMEACRRYVPTCETNHDYIKILQLEDLAHHLAEFTGLAVEAWLDYLKRSPTP